MKFYSEETKRFYDTAEACKEAEDKAKAKREEAAAKAAKLKEERANRAKEVEEAIAHANELLNKFVEDYGSFHYTYSIGDLFDFNKKWFLPL